MLDSIRNRKMSERNKPGQVNTQRDNGKDILYLKYYIFVTPCNLI